MKHVNKKKFSILLNKIIEQKIIMVFFKNLKNNPNNINAKITPIYVIMKF